MKIASKLFALTLFALTLFAAAIALAGVVRAEGKLELKKGDKIVYIGNTLAERMQYYPRFETLLQARFPELELEVRNLGWSADEIELRPRSQDFQDHGNNLEDHKPDVILAFFGFNESFAGPGGLKKFEEEFDKFVKTTSTTKYNGESAPQLVIVSPIPNEDLHSRTLPNGKANNKNIELYAAAMKKIAEANNVLFVDVYAPMKEKMAGESDLTINTIHLNDDGYKAFAEVLDAGLFGAKPEYKCDLEKLYAEVYEKDLQFFYDYRAVNGFYIYGGRKNPFGVVNFPAEFEKLRKMTAMRDQRIWSVAAGKEVAAKIDDSETGEFTKIESNVDRPISFDTPEEALKSFKLPEGYKINLFASEQDFPELRNPVQFAFDAKGRLWVATMETYPMYLPGTPVSDKILIFEDTDGDGKADKKTVFADGLHLPTGIELGDGGCYVAAQPNLIFLKDVDGDDKADEKTYLLHGFDSADSHHSISAFTWGPGGALYFQEGTFHHTQVETPYGPERVKNAAVFRFEPLTDKFDIFVSYSFANPWGHTFDDWGQNFVADASGGANYFGTAFSGDVDYPNKHPGMKQFLKKQWRPTSGCEFVSSRNFPESAQGNYLLNNCIGFQGVLQYKMKEDGSGFAADPVEPLLQSSDLNFRPVDLQFGPDGALYIVDWYNPLVGHMQHSVRDPKRDNTHGRIWRITYTGNDLVKPAKIAGEPIPALLEQLKTYEYRTRYRVRRELRERDPQQVNAELAKWIAGLDANDKLYEHNLLEALWVKQSLDIVDQDLLQKMLRAADPRARAAATRVLCYWRDQVEEPLAMLQSQVNDENPRVRLEAVRALSFFRSQEALDIALESLAYDQDYYLEYTLGETIKTLEGRVGAKN
ncbi:GDSL-type esterase/lipase family protein [Blastopirellula sp. JC732]|uniref:GDSL-type esterase/lipase family protein n=1 Tax=Blastopirellula sediminis TaxID=2894196 RepID=A0A9X1MIQ2_9BACT|nr:PVC-type heme-binding CxxCH protein [Blastopirellula sediminis]MCC9604375.1 GDSL-type esterase/lipase family protein [Blastopirellula sediminis]MCC9626895.1 GDSL-type esterase/lipase family protein [Blastopirellula sediminis]